MTTVKPTTKRIRIATTTAVPPAAAAGPKGRPKRLSGLDAAAQILAQAKEPLGCADLTKRILDKGLWKTKGKTPAATISSAILREIKAKGKASRFRKSGRGLFLATNAR